MVQRGGGGGMYGMHGERATLSNSDKILIVSEMR